MNKLWILALPLVLMGCETTQPTILTKEKLYVVNVPEALYNCPELKYLPKIETLTDIEVAKVIVNLDKNNRTCRASIEAVRNYLSKAARAVQ